MKRYMLPALGMAISIVTVLAVSLASDRYNHLATEREILVNRRIAAAMLAKEIEFADLMKQFLERQKANRDSIVEIQKSIKAIEDKK